MSTRASAHGRAASANKSAYVAAKHGVVGLTKVTALETAGSGITCNAICPGWVLTPLVKKQIEDRASATGQSYEEAKLEMVAAKTTSQEFSTPQQIGRLATSLFSPSAAQSMGAAPLLDGGRRVVEAARAKAGAWTCRCSGWRQHVQHTKTKA